MSKRASLVDVGLHRKGAAIPAAQDPEPEAKKERLVKVSVGLSPALYERLKLFGVRRRRTNQDIMVDALLAYLQAEGEGGEAP